MILFYEVELRGIAILLVPVTDAIPFPLLLHLEYNMMFIDLT